MASLNDAAQFQKLSKKYSDRLILLLTYTVLLSGLVLANQAIHGEHVLPTCHKRLVAH